MSFGTGIALFAATAFAQEGKVWSKPVIEANGDTSDAKRSFEEICTENGFQFEIHEVTTEDGYELNVFRIPGLVSESQSNVTKPPVLF